MDETYNYDEYDVRVKSTFVTVVGIIFIAFAVISLFAVLAQFAIFTLFSFVPGLSESMQESGSMPPFTRVMSSYAGPFMAAAFVASIVQLIASIGLLLRKNWARILFIVVLSYLIAFKVMGVVAQFYIVPSLPENMPQSSPMFLETFTIFIRMFTIIISVVFCILYVWIISKLLSKKIRMEFLPQIQPENYQEDQGNVNNI